jgi:exopolysaccharide production protein ExoQ
MSQLIATVLFVVLIIGLFVLSRDKKMRTSKALWIPLIYLLIIGSRPVSSWLGDTASKDALYGDGIYSSPIDGDINFGLMALAVIVLFTRRDKVWPLLQRSIPMLLFYSYAALSMLWSDFPMSTLKHWSKAVEDVMMVLLIATDRDPKGAMKRLLTSAGFILIPLSLLFAKYYPDLGRSFNKDWETIYNGVTETKNMLGLSCLIFGLTSVWCLLAAYKERKGASRNRHLLAYGIMLATIVVLLGMSHSATASVCLMLSGGVMIVVSRGSRGATVSTVHLAAAAALCVALVPLFIAPSLVQSLGRDATFSGRTTIWHILPTFVRNPWLGAGYETFLMGPRLVQLKAIIDKTFQEAHNGYLEVWLNLGWIGVFFFAVLLVTGYGRVVAAFRRDPTVGNLRLAFFVAVVIEGMTEAPFRMLSPTWFLLLWAMTDDWKAVRVPPRRLWREHSPNASAWSDVSATQDDLDTTESEILASVSGPSALTKTTRTNRSHGTGVSAPK